MTNIGIRIASLVSALAWVAWGFALTMSWGKENWTLNDSLKGYAVAINLMILSGIILVFSL